MNAEPKSVLEATPLAPATVLTPKAKGSEYVPVGVVLVPCRRSAPATNPPEPIRAPEVCMLIAQRPDVVRVHMVARA